MHSKVPAAAYTKIVFCRYDVDQPVILCCNFLKQLRRTICRVIVHNDYIEWEITFL